MESSLTAIGFSELDEEYTVEDLLEQVLKDAEAQQFVEIEGKHILAEYTQKISENTYINARVGLDKDTTKKDSKIEVYDCEAYVLSDRVLDVCDVEIECIDNIGAHYVICEEKTTSMQMIFWLQNVVEYLKGKRQHKTCTQINIAAIANEGTIILPIEQDEEDEQLEKEEREKIRDIIQLMKDGDEEAKQRLEAEEKELDQQLKERLYQEDFLTIMSRYFIPVTLQDAVYAVLGEIVDIKERENSKTNELMYDFTLNVNDVLMDVVISKKQLVGMPSIGMRFMGTCWLQGKVIMS